MVDLPPEQPPLIEPKPPTIAGGRPVSPPMPPWRLDELRLWHATHRERMRLPNGVLVQGAEYAHHRDVGDLLRMVDRLMADLSARLAELSELARQVEKSPTAIDLKTVGDEAFTVGTVPLDREGLSFWNAMVDTALKAVDVEAAKHQGRSTHVVIEAIRVRLRTYRKA